MIAKGRTMWEARDAGTLFEVSHPTFAKYGCQFPAAETPAEAAGCMAWPWATYQSWYPAGTQFEVRRVLKGSTIGFTILGAEIWTFRFERGAMVEEGCVMPWDALSGSTVAELNLGLNPEQVRWIDAVLSNDDVSTEQELREYFIENGLTREQADAVLRARFGESSQRVITCAECGFSREDVHRSAEVSDPYCCE